jgi:hypothetical protein
MKEILNRRLPHSLTHPHEMKSHLDMSLPSSPTSSSSASHNVLSKISPLSSFSLSGNGKKESVEKIGQRNKETRTDKGGETIPGSTGGGRSWNKMIKEVAESEQKRISAELIRTKDGVVIGGDNYLLKGKDFFSQPFASLGMMTGSTKYWIFYYHCFNRYYFIHFFFFIVKSFRTFC